MTLKEVISAHGFTLKAVAERLPPTASGKPVSLSGLSQIVNGSPRMESVREIADVLGIPLSQLFYEMETGTVPNKPANILTCPKCGTKVEITIKLAET